MYVCMQVSKYHRPYKQALFVWSVGINDHYSVVRNTSKLALARLQTANYKNRVKRDTTQAKAYGCVDVLTTWHRSLNAVATHLSTRRVKRVIVPTHWSSIESLLVVRWVLSTATNADRALYGLAWETMWEESHSHGYINIKSVQHFLSVNEVKSTKWWVCLGTWFSTWSGSNLMVLTKI